MFIKVVEEVSLHSNIKEHFNFWETDFRDINFIYIWRPSRTPTCLMRQPRRVHQQTIQFNDLLLGDEMQP